MANAETADTALAAAAGFMVEVVFCPLPGQVDATRMQLSPGATLHQAVQQSGVLARHGLLGLPFEAGVWGKRQPPEHVLRQNDRVELYRPLVVDPKEARRQRYGRHKEAARLRLAAKAERVALDAANQAAAN